MPGGELAGHALEFLERNVAVSGAGVREAFAQRSVSADEVVKLTKTARSRRQVPLSPRALEALEELPARLDTPPAAKRPDLMVETLVVDTSKPYHRLFERKTVAHAQANLDAYHAGQRRDGSVAE